MNNPLFTIVTVCKNEFNTIDKTIRSVLRQKTKCDVEYIIVDGGSTDGSLDVIDTYRKDIDIIVSEPDGGIYDAMNKGLRMASGKWVGFLNCGDYYSDDALEVISEYLNKTGVDIIYGNVMMIEKDKELGVDKADEIFSKIMFSMVLCHQAVFVNTEKNKKHEFDTSYGIAADRKMLAELFLDGCTFYYIDKTIAFYDVSGVSASDPYRITLENCRITYELDRNKSFLSISQKDFLYESLMINEFWKDWDIELSQEKWDINKYFISIINPNKKLLIWGTGKYAHKAEVLFLELGYEIAGFIDSDPRDGKIGKYTVSRPEDMIVENNSVIVIASRKYSDEIENSIKKYDNLENLPVYRLIELLTRYERSLGKTIESVLYGEA